MPHVLTDSEAVRAASAIRLVLTMHTALATVYGAVPLSNRERAELARIADRLHPQEVTA